jgi:hypothetical protein
MPNMIIVRAYTIRCEEGPRATRRSTGAVRQDICVLPPVCQRTLASGVSNSTSCLCVRIMVYSSALRSITVWLVGGTEASQAELCPDPPAVGCKCTGIRRVDSGTPCPVAHLHRLSRVPGHDEQPGVLRTFGHRRRAHCGRPTMRCRHWNSTLSVSTGISAGPVGPSGPVLLPGP